MLKALTTPLNAVHREMNARMVDFGGWEMPLHYGSQIEEHRQVRRDAGMFDVSHMLVVDLEGAGVRRAQIVNVGPCTRCTATEYFSHRAANGQTGRQWSFIGWQA